MATKFLNVKIKNTWILHLITLILMQTNNKIKKFVEFLNSLLWYKEIPKKERLTFKRLKVPCWNLTNIRNIKDYSRNCISWCNQKDHVRFKKRSKRNCKRTNIITGNIIEDIIKKQLTSYDHACRSAWYRIYQTSAVMVASRMQKKRQSQN